jgi:hypothetical protein
MKGESLNSLRDFSLTEITLDYAMYGRGEVNTTRVAALTEMYTEHPDTFEPIRLWVDDGVIKLCDGFARYLAAQAASLPYVTGFIDETIQTAHAAKRASMQHNTREKDAIPKGRLDAYIIEAWREGLTAREIQIDVNKSTAYISAVLKPCREMEAWMRDLAILRLALAGHTDEEIAEDLGGDITRQRVGQLRENLFLENQICTILHESRPDYVAIRDDRLGPYLLNPWDPPPLNLSFDVLSGMAIVEQEHDGSSYWSWATNLPSMARRATLDAFQAKLSKPCCTSTPSPLTMSMTRLRAGGPPWMCARRISGGIGGVTLPRWRPVGIFVSTTSSVERQGSSRRATGCI